MANIFNISLIISNQDAKEKIFFHEALSSAKRKSISEKCVF